MEDYYDKEKKEGAKSAFKHLLKRCVLPKFL